MVETRTQQVDQQVHVKDGVVRKTCNISRDDWTPDQLKGAFEFANLDTITPIERAIALWQACDSRKAWLSIKEEQPVM